MGKREEEQRLWLLQSGKAVLCGGVVAFAVGLLCLLFASFGISEGWIDADTQYGITVLACVIGSFCGGLAAVRQCAGKRLLVGVAEGMIMFLIELTVGIVFFEIFSLENGGVGLLCGCLCGGAAAGILSGGKRHVKIKKRVAKRR